MTHKPNIYHANRCPPCPKSATAFEKSVYWLGIGLGSGLPKRAAGTWGTLGGLLLALIIAPLGFEFFLVMTIMGGLLGSYVCGKTSDLMGVHDDPHIVWDEWVGMWIALLPVMYLDKYLFTFYYTKPNSSYFWFGVLASFILFRFFDVIKPFPIKWVDKNVSGGFGILIDDILAGIMSAVVFVLICLMYLSAYVQPFNFL